MNPFHPIPRCAGPGRRLPWCGALALLVFAAGLAGCRTAPPLPRIDLSQPGWTVLQGQAVWTAARGEKGVAGELMVATRPNGSCWVQFSKPPFNLFTAQRQESGWSVEFQQGHKRYAGPGAPPGFIWFQLAKAVAGQAPDAGWQFTCDPEAGWVLSHAGKGEKLEGYFSP